MTPELSLSVGTRVIGTADSPYCGCVGVVSDDIIASATPLVVVEFEGSETCRVLPAHHVAPLGPGAKEWT